MQYFTVFIISKQVYSAVRCNPDVTHSRVQLGKQTLQCLAGAIGGAVFGISLARFTR